MKKIVCLISIVALLVIGSGAVFASPNVTPDDYSITTTETE